MLNRFFSALMFLIFCVSLVAVISCLSILSLAVRAETPTETITWLGGLLPPWTPTPTPTKVPATATPTILPTAYPGPNQEVNFTSPKANRSFLPFTGVTQ